MGRIGHESSGAGDNDTGDQDIPGSAERKRFRSRGGAALRPPRGRLGAAFIRAPALRGATAGFDFLAALFAPVRLTPGLAAVGVAFFGAADFPRRFGLPHRRPPPLRRRDDPRPPLRAEAAFLLAGLRWRWRRGGDHEALGAAVAGDDPLRIVAGALRRARTRPSFRSPAAR